MTKFKGAIKSGSLLGFISIVLLSLVLLNSNSQSVPMNLTQYSQSNATTAVVNGSVNFPNSTLMQANQTMVQLTLNITYNAGVGMGQVAAVENISRLVITLPADNSPGKINFTYARGSNSTTVSAPAAFPNFTNDTRGGDLRDVLMENVVNITWNSTGSVGLVQNQSGNGVGNNSRNFTFNLSSIPNVTGTYVFNISSWNSSSGTTLAPGNYSATGFAVTLVDLIEPVHMWAVDGPYGSQRGINNRVFNESPTSINGTSNLTVAVNFTINDPLLSAAGMQVCVNATAGDGSTANSTCYNVTATSANMFKSVTTGYAIAQTGFKSSQNGMYNLTLWAEDNGTVGTDTNGGNANFTRTSARNTTFFWIVDDTPPTTSLTVLRGGNDVNGKIDVETGTKLTLTCSASDGHSGLVSGGDSITVTDPNGGKTTNLKCGDTYTPQLAKSTTDAYTVSYSTRNGANLNGTSTATFGTIGFKSIGSSTSGSSASTPSATSQVLATKTLTVTESVKPEKPLELTPPADILSQGLTKLQITVSKEVAAADATVEVKALKEIPSKDNEGQALKSLPSNSQLPLKVLQISPSAILKSSTTKATIGFSLTKAELGSTSPSDIVLARFVGGAWVELPTTAGTAKSDGSVEFSAVTPGFSVFVVTTKAPAVLQEPLLEETTASSPDLSPTPSKSAEARIIKRSDPSLLYGGIIAVIIIAFFAGILVLKLKRKKK